MHFRYAINSGLKIFPGKKPFTRIEDSLIPNKKEKNIYVNNKDQFFNYGYWTSENFLEGMYYREFWQDITKRHKNFDKTIVKDNKMKYATFKGIIATSRVCKKENSKGFITFVTIGTSNNVFHDLVLYGCHKISSMSFIKGYGKIKSDGIVKWIDVNKFNPEYI